MLEGGLADSMFTVIDGPFHFLEGFKGQFDRKSLLVCFQVPCSSRHCLQDSLDWDKGGRHDLNWKPGIKCSGGLDRSHGSL